jgi:hypothetical protein
MHFYQGIKVCLQCGGECVIWQESIDEQPWEKVRSRYPFVQFETSLCFICLSHLHLSILSKYCWWLLIIQVTMHDVAFLQCGYMAIYHFCFCSSPLKVKEDDEVDKLEINIDTPKRSKRTYPSPSPEVAMKISRSLRVSCVSLHVERHIHAHMQLHLLCQ